LLEEYDALQAELRDDDVGLSGKLRISAPISFGEAYVLDDIMAFQDLHPDLEVDIQLNDRYVDLAGEGFDLAIRIGRLEDSGLFSRKLSTTRLLPVASPSYLAQHGEPVHPNELQDHNCFRDSNFRQGYNWPFYINGQEQKVAIKGGIIVNSTTAVRDLALSGRGICLCPSYVVQNDIKAGRLMHILPDFESISLTIQVVFSDNKKMPSRTRAMLDFLVERYKSAAWL
jgi:DNA-binding transcriptional LysR family regulator